MNINKGSMNAAEESMNDIEESLSAIEEALSAIEENMNAIEEEIPPNPLSENEWVALYEMIDDSSFYKPHSINEHRSDMNVVFNLSEENLLQQFLSEAKENGLYALKGHRNVGGARASIYNAMPLEGVQSLADFMKDFERKNG